MSGARGGVEGGGGAAVPLARLQEQILYLLSSSGEAAVPSEQIMRTVAAPPERFSAAIRSLLEDSRVAIHHSAGAGGRRSVFLALASSDLSENTSIVYEAVRASGTSGVDQQQLTARLRLPKADIIKALRSLVQGQRIKEQRSFTNRAKKIYLLTHLQPSAQVTGGTLYAGDELDSVLVDDLRQGIVAFISRHRSVSFRQVVRFIDSQSSSSGGGGGDGGEDDFGFGSAGVDDFAFPSAPPQTSARMGCGDDDGDGDTERPSSPIALIHASGSHYNAMNNNNNNINPRGSGVGLPVGGAVRRAVKTKDVRVLLQTLVLDGVVEEVAADVLGRPVGSYYATGVSCLDAVAEERERGGPISSSAARDDGRGGEEEEEGVGGGQDAKRFRLATGGNVMRHFTAAQKRQQRRLASGTTTATTTPSPSHALKKGRAADDSDGVGGEEEGAERRRRRRLAYLYDEMQRGARYEPASVSLTSASPPLLLAGASTATTNNNTTTTADGSAVASWGYMAAVGFPCLGCAQLESCTATGGSGFINVSRCAYLAEWLQ